VQVHLVSIRPGDDTTEYHRHIYEEEWLYILSGKGEAVIENAETGEPEAFEVWALTEAVSQCLLRSPVQPTANA
jgi:oxalate decarboxylase/phosphoglucose isomerase-like protein (cupin superfamily)